MIDAHHYVKLALMNVRLLNDIERARSSCRPIEDIVAARVRNDSIGEPVSLRHQATFLQFGYISLVWLRESVRKHLPKDEAAIDDHLARRLSGVQLPKGNGPRLIDSWSDVVRLARNAISHARVVCDDTHFEFTDHDKGREASATSLQLTWEELGRLSEAYLFAVQEVLYP